jgi:cysteine desulfurase
MRIVYFDHNATTPLHPEVIEVIKEKLELYGNASSAHQVGRAARKEIETVREQIKRFLNGSNGGLIFTSGGSESNNMVLKGVTCQVVLRDVPNARVGTHIITSQVEHPSVLETLRCLEKLGYAITYLPVDRYGMVDPDDVRKAIRPSTLLISIMYANNEVGTIQPIKEIARIARENDILMHTDAVQAFGKIPIDVEELGVDFLSLSGHKINAPKGVGALYVRPGLRVCPLIHGGHQEHGERAGTENTLGILALGKATEVAERTMTEHVAQLRRLRDRLEQGLLERVPDTFVNGHPEQRLPGTTNISFRFIEGEAILFRLDGKGICVSTGSACSSGSLEPSHVLMAMGLSHEDAHGSIRFSLGYGNTDEDVDYALEQVPDVIAGLRAMSPLFNR